MLGVWFRAFTDSAKNNMEITLFVLLMAGTSAWWAEQTFATEDAMDEAIAASILPLQVAIKENGDAIHAIQIAAYERERRSLTRQITQITAAVETGNAEDWQLIVLSDLKSDVQQIDAAINRLDPD